MPIQLSGSLVITGSITTTGVILMSGSIASASYSSTSDLLQGTGSVGFATTASLLAVSSSQQQISASLLNVVANYATTGSNSFRANQSITGSLVVSSTITAQTLVVQTVTSSILYSSGSNNFGNQLSNNQTFTGSVNITGSLAIAGNITGNAITLTGALSGTSANFNSTLTAAGATINGNATISVNQNSLTRLIISNTTAGTGAYVETSFTSDSSAGAGSVGKFGSSTTPYKITTASNTYLYNSSVAGDIAILNDFSSGAIKMAAGGSSTSHFTIASTGAATFSSSVTAANGYFGPTSNQVRLTSQGTFQSTTLDTYIINADGTGAYGSGDLLIQPRCYSGGGANKIVFATSNNTNTPVERLTIASTGAATFSANSTTLNVNTSTRVLEVTGKNSYYATQIIGGTGTGTSYGLSVNAGTNSSDVAFQVYNQTESAIRLFVRGDGNVGIGTTSPVTNLEVVGSLGATGLRYSSSPAKQGVYLGNSSATPGTTDYATIEMCGGATGGCEIDFTKPGFDFRGRIGYDISTDYMWLVTAATEKIRITNNGNVLIGITSDYAYQGGALLRVNKEQNTGTNIQINNQAANASAAAHVIFSTNGNGWVVGMGSQYSSTGNTFYFSPDPSGALNKVATLTTGGVWSTSGGGTSDLRTKQDVEYEFDNGIESILKLQPTKFKFKTAPDKQRRGFIAQDVLKTIPDLVLGDGELESGIYGLDYDGILTLAVKAIQELEARVKELEKK